MSSGRDDGFSFERLTALIALCVALSFLYGYRYQFMLFSKFGLDSMVPYLNTSMLGLSGALAASGLFLFFCAIGFLCPEKEFGKKVFSWVALLLALLCSILFFVFEHRAKISATETLNASRYFTTFVVISAAVCMWNGVMHYRDDERMSSVFYFIVGLLMFVVLAPYIDAHRRVIAIVTQKEWALPIIVKGDNSGWSVFSMNGSQAVLVKFEGPGNELRSRIKIDTIDGAEIKTWSQLSYSKVFE